MLHKARIFDVNEKLNFMKRVFEFTKPDFEDTNQ
jgi:hypothetical protein